MNHVNASARYAVHFDEHWMLSLDFPHEFEHVHQIYVSGRFKMNILGW
jgi:hypothetical protein